MVARIDIFIDDNEVRNYLKRIMRETPNRANNIVFNMAQIYAGSIKKSANDVFSYPRPYLSKTIRAKKFGEWDYTVEAASYAAHVEKGRRPGKQPPPLKIIEDWANKAGIEPYFLYRSIAEKGTKARPFIDPGIAKAEPRIKSYLKKEVGRLAK